MRAGRCARDVMTPAFDALFQQATANAMRLPSKVTGEEVRQKAHAPITLAPPQLAQGRPVCLKALRALRERDRQALHGACRLRRSTAATSASQYDGNRS